MGLSANLIEEICKYIDLLYSSLGMFSDKDLKYQVQQIQKYYHKGISPDNFDLDSIVYPFILACNSNKSKYGNLTLDFMMSLFKFSSSELYPSIELAKNLLSLALLISKDSNYETSIKSVQFVNLIFSSYAGFHVIIGELLETVYKIIIYASNSHEYKNTDKELIDHVLSAGIRFIIMRSLDSSVKIHIDNFNNYAKTILNTVYKDSSSIVKDIQEPNDEISVLDLDMIAIYHSLYELIESENLKRSTVNQIAMLICRSMNTEIDFWKKPFAKEMAKEFIIPAYEEIVAATNSKMNLELPCSFSVIIWDKLGLITDHKQLIIQISYGLSQNNDEMFYYACEMLKKLSQSPEFLVSILNSQLRNGNKTILSIFKDLCDLSIPKSDVVSHKQQEAMIVIGKLFKCFDKLMKGSIQHPNIDRNNEILLYCADVFSNDFQQGLDLFIKNNFCDFESIGEFLYKYHDNLDKLRLGELLALGDIKIFNQFIEFLPKNNIWDLINELFRYILIPKQKEVYENLIKRISHLIHEDFLANDEDAFNYTYEIIRISFILKEKKMNSQFNNQDILHELSSKGYNETISKSIVETANMIDIDQKPELLNNNLISENDEKKTEIAVMNIRTSIVDVYYYPLITIFDGIYDICYELLKKSLNFCSDFPKENLMYCEGSLLMLKAFLGLSSYSNQFAKFEDLLLFSEFLIQKYLKNGIKEVPNRIIKKLSKCFPTIRTSWREYTQFILRNQIDIDLNIEHLDLFSIKLMIEAFDEEFYDENMNPNKLILMQILNIMLHATRFPDFIWKQVWKEIKQKVLIGIIHYKISLKFVELSIVNSHNSGYNRQDQLFEAYLTAYPDANYKQKTRIVDSISHVINSLKDQIDSSWIYILQIVALDEMKDNQNCSSQALDILEKCVTDYSKQSRKFASYIITAISQILNTSNCIETRLRVISLIPLVADDIINNVEEFEMLTDVLMSVFAEQEEIIIELGESYTYKIISSIIDKRDYVDVMMPKICRRSFSIEQGELINKLFKENKIPLYVNFNGYNIV